ncbi:protein of unknown function [Thalassobaculum litoreum DSM 18839]|uniref:DUF3576 domain-containing protein n=1 Tax=Thalassobaculum litoreum DSM 18839 TaxID=1123362 RepID=A0A8G2BJZ4_9PROT|nr:MULTISPECIES: DUF3576 domain-containing protein [Thalassobaculum]SDG12244.1 protein of unknown function [Thalassobaculum litoreum DSM 18839]
MAGSRSTFKNAVGAGVLCLLALSACGTDVPVEYEYPTTGPNGLPTYEKQESLAGPSGLDLFSLGQGDQNNQGGGGVAVNAFLWRASLDTLSFLPLSSADPFGGVIISDWYNPPESPNERFKVTVYILDRALRSDGIRANVFRQTRSNAGDWRDAAVDESLGKDLENTILTRARQIRIQQASQ